MRFIGSACMLAIVLTLGGCSYAKRSQHITKPVERLQREHGVRIGDYYLDGKLRVKDVMLRPMEPHGTYYRFVLENQGDEDLTLQVRLGARKDLRDRRDNTLLVKQWTTRVVTIPAGDVTMVQGTHPGPFVGDMGLDLRWVRR